MTANDPIHVLCTRTFTPAQCDQLRAASPRIVIEQRPAASRAELMHVLTPEVEVLFGTFAPDSVAPLPRLRWFQSRSAGMNAVIGTPIWSAPEVLLTNSSGIHGPSIAEYTIGMMIALARDFRGLLSFQQRSCWPMAPKNHVQQFPGRELRGATVLIIGYGSIGREIGRQCRALGLRVVAIKRDPTQLFDHGFALPGTGDPQGVIPDRVLGPGELEVALPEAEYIVLASASTAENRRLLGEAELRCMRPDAFLVNVGRGDLVDEAALVAALREGRIAGAALDVFEREPLPADSPLWSLDNVILSPHVSGITPRYDDHLAVLFAENLGRYARGEPLLNIVDRALGY